MKKLVFSSLVGLALVAFTGCTNGNDANASKCSASKKCDGAAKCSASKKCSGAAKCSAGK
jgi:hypothetical protein